MLRHATDGSQWSKINKEFPNFADNTRNLMFGLIKDGMNLFGKESSRHSTWLVTLMYLQPSLDFHEVEVPYDTCAHPRPKAT